MATIVIGVDGATFDIIQPLIDEGHLPNFKMFMVEGCYGVLESSMPPITPPAWMSFYTGRNPGKHGIFGFGKYNPDPNLNYFELVDFLAAKTPTIWDLLKKQNKRSCLVNLPITFPVPELDGICVSGMGTPSTSSDFTYPPHLKDDILKRFPKFAYLSVVTTLRLKDLGRWVMEKLAQEDIRKDIALHYFEKEKPDFLMVVFQTTDGVAHKCLTIQNDPERLKALEVEDKPVKMAYQTVDRIIGEIKTRLGDEHNYILMSDHGFGMIDHYFFTNNWLLKNGYIVIKKVSLGNIRKRYSISWKNKTVQDIVTKLGLFRYFKKFLSSALLNKRINLPVLKNNWLELIDWSKTTAYSANYGIYLNLKGRENTGIVSSGTESDRLKQEITCKLIDVVDPETQEQIVIRTHLNEDIYSGSQSVFGSDIMFEMKSGYQQNNDYRFGDIVKKCKVGSHTMSGVFFAHGKDFKQGFKVEGANIMDVMPTILALNDVPIPRETDGKVLTDCFRDEVRDKIKIVYSDEVDVMTEFSGRVYTDEEREIVMENLKGLGYL